MNNFIGLVGAGYWGKNLVRDFYKLGVLKKVCDIDINLLNEHKSKYPNIVITTDWNDILEDNSISAVCVSLPAHMHYKFAKEALEHNKDVYIEKPITLDIKEAEQLIELAKEKNRVLMVGHLLQYHIAVEKIKELINGGVIGKIKNITSNRFNLGKLRVHENVLWSFAPHDISIVLSLCSNKLPDKIVSNGNGFITEGINDITNLSLIWEKEGIYANINADWLNPNKEQKMTIVGTKGIIVFDDTKKEDKLVLYRDYVDRSSVPPQVIKKPKIVELDLSVFPLERECAHFIDCCKNRTKPITDGEEALRVLKVLKFATKESKKEQEYFVHESAVVDNGAKIGKGSKIWHYTHVSKGCEIGEKCNIGQNVYIAPNAKLGDNCKVQNNVSVYAGVTCEDGVFLGPSCVLTNDINPRAEYSKHGNYMKTYIEKGATIGANSTIICGNRIGRYALIGAGAVVTKDVKPYTIVVGNPAKVIGTIDEHGNRKLN